MNILRRRRRTFVRTAVVTAIAGLTTLWLPTAAGAAPPQNRPPVARADAATITVNAVPNTVSGNVLTNDTDPDGDTLTVITPGTFGLRFGRLVVRASGAYVYTLNNSNPLVGSLRAGQRLTDLFGYLITDGHGHLAGALITVTINGANPNRPPVAVADTNTVTEDTAPNPVQGNVLTNDSDPDGNTLSVADAGTFALSYGTLVLHADGIYTYTLDNSNPTVNALNTGQTLSDVFTYTVSDGHGGTATAALTVTINGTTDG